MRVMIVDDDEKQLQEAVQALKKAEPGAKAVIFSDPFLALNYLEHHTVEVVLIDVELKVMDGLALAKYIQGKIPMINIIFSATHSRFVREAMQMHVSGYILKPITPDKLTFELSHLRNSPQRKSNKGLWVKTFGNFEVFYNGEPLRFNYTKTKELFAYLIDRRGSLSTNRQLQVVLWEDDDSGDKTSYFKRIRKDLLDTLAQHNLENIIERSRGMLGVSPARIPCDFYEWIRDRETGSQYYAGEYMSQYEWAEYTHGWIESTK